MRRSSCDVDIGNKERVGEIRTRVERKEREGDKRKMLKERD